MGEKASLDKKKRLEDLLAKLEPGRAAGKTLRELRAVEVLEWLGTNEAEDVLRALSQGAEGSRLTEEARAALVRSNGKTNPGNR